MDSELLILLVLTVAAVWFLIDFLRYLDIRGQRCLNPTERSIYSARLFALKLGGSC